MAPFNRKVTCTAGQLTNVHVLLQKAAYLSKVLFYNHLSCGKNISNTMVYSIALGYLCLAAEWRVAPDVEHTNWLIFCVSFTKKIRSTQNKNVEACFLSPKHDLRSPALAKTGFAWVDLFIPSCSSVTFFREDFLGLQINQHKDFQQIHLGE